MHTSKGKYQKTAGKLHLLPIATRPCESIGMDFIGPFLEVNGYNYLWVVICRMTSCTSKHEDNSISTINNIHTGNHTTTWITILNCKILNSHQNSGMNYTE